MGSKDISHIFFGFPRGGPKIIVMCLLYRFPRGGPKIIVTNIIF